MDLMPEEYRMANENVEQTVRQVICDRLDKKPEEVTLDARFVEDLGADSLDVVELMMALEEEFNIDIDDEANQIETVGDAIKYVESRT